MILKKVSFDNYIKRFYNYIKVNSPFNKEIESIISTPIFYRMDHGNLVISFAYDNFYIEVTKSLALYRKEHEEFYEDSMENVPELMNWIDDKYMDDRGIPEDC